MDFLPVLCPSCFLLWPRYPSVSCYLNPSVSVNVASSSYPALSMYMPHFSYPPVLASSACCPCDILFLFIFRTSHASNQRTQGSFYFYFFGHPPLPTAIMQQHQDWLGYPLVHLLQEDLSVSMYAGLFSALAEGSGLDEETLYNLFIDGLAGNIRDAVLLDQVIQLAVSFETFLQDNQAQLNTPVRAPSPVPVRASSPVRFQVCHPALAFQKVCLKPRKPLRPCRSLRVAVSLVTQAWLEAPGRGRWKNTHSHIHVCKTTT